jgi:hypothetical protein
MLITFGKWAVPCNFHEMAGRGSTSQNFSYDPAGLRNRHRVLKVAFVIFLPRKKLIEYKAYQPRVYEFTSKAFVV